ncbi:MAG: winged helix-turn-helix transcriptional regulator [Bacteroidales bacterium]|nr:winged helix-turn-helix transcriptional regulator [Bacteroidales bacterium]
MNKIYEIVQASAALEGSTLTPSECRRLLDEGVSSEGKTIAEQLLCLNLRAAYEKCFRLAADHEFWSVYRLKAIAAVALRDAGVSAENVSDEAVLRKVCDMANSRRLHIGSDSPAEQYKASFEIHYLISVHKPWEAGNDYIGRLLMNYLQNECRLEPTVIRPSKRAEYLRILGVAKREEIGEVFVSYMCEHCCDKPEKEAETPKAAPTESPAPAASAPRRAAGRPAKPAASVPDIPQARPSSREAILALLKKNPYMSTRDLAAEIGISAKGVEKQLGILKANGQLRRVGPDKGGKWVVL